MNIAKLCFGAALVATPFSLIFGQSSGPSDSSNGGHRVGWATLTAAATGAGLFMAFTRSGRGGAASSSGFDPHSSDTTPSTPTTPGNGLAPSRAGGPSAPPADPVTPDTARGATPPPPDNPPTAPTDSQRYQDGPAGPVDDAPTGPSNNPPYEEPQPFVQESSTVPEPGSLALTATGIIGLIPVMRRRHK